MSDNYVMTSFTQFNLLRSLQEALTEKGLVTPTEIQGRTIPKLLAGQSVIGVSETGSGKTLAYSLPILHFIKSLEVNKDPVNEESRPRALVLVPTRELGEQVTKVMKPFTHTTRVRVRSVLGGTTFEVAKRNISGAFEILVATPGRLVQLLDRKLITLSDVRILVFDEADQMLDQGFLPDAKRIASECPPTRQLALFSATVTSQVQALMSELFQTVDVARSSGSHKIVPTLKTINRKIENGERFPVLQALLDQEPNGGTLIFVNTREQCDKLAEQMRDANRRCLIYRGEMDKVVRRKNLGLFRDKKVRVLIATDLAARGLDVEHVNRVINYHMPKEMEAYIHRVGRTARAGRDGLVVNLVTERDKEVIQKIEKLR